MAENDNLKKILISTIYDGTRVPYLIKELNPSEVYFVMDNDETRRKTFQRLKKVFEDMGLKVSEINIPKTHSIFEITKGIFNKINELRKKGNIIQIGVCEGMKPMAFGAMYASYLNHEKIEGVYYILHDTAELVNYPLLNFNIRNGRKDILRLFEEAERNNIRVTSSYLVEKSKKATSSVYENIKQLLDEGFIKKKERDEYELTEFGRIVLLN